MKETTPSGKRWASFSSRTLTCSFSVPPPQQAAFYFTHHFTPSFAAFAILCAFALNTNDVANQQSRNPERPN